MNTRHLAIAAVALGIAISSGQSAEIELEKTRTALEEWVELRKLISEEENVWRAEKETIQSSIELIKSETERIDKEIKDAEESATAAVKRRQELNDENQALKDAASTVVGAIPKLEERIVALAESFPEDLRSKIAPLFQRIPKKGVGTRAGAGERLQNIVGILGEVEKFNRTITKTSELQKLPNGDNAQVDTIYLGLSVAFFVDGKNTYAGILRPAKGAWVVEPRNDLAGAIRKVVEMYTGNQPEAEFIALPVEIK